MNNLFYKCPDCHMPVISLRLVATHKEVLLEPEPISVYQLSPSGGAQKILAYQPHQCHNEKGEEK